MSKRILCFLLAIILTFNVVSVDAKASSNITIAETISQAEWAENGSELLTLALEEFATMSGASATNVCVIAGSALFAYVATLGLKFAREKSIELARTLGNHIISNLASYDSEVQRYIASIIFNIVMDKTYYDNKYITYPSTLLDSLGVYYTEYIDANAISLNQGMSAQSIIPDSILSQMTTSDFEFYEKMGGRYVYTFDYMSFDNVNSDDGIYMIRKIPDSVSFIFIDTDDNTALGYTADGQIWYGYESASMSYANYDKKLGEGYDHFWECVEKNSYTSFGVPNLLSDNPLYSACVFGVTVLIGTTLATARDFALDYSLGLDYSGAYDEPLAITSELVAPYTTAIDWGTGAKSITEDENTDTPSIGATSNILDWLSNAWGIFSSILAAITDLPTAIANAIKNIINVGFFDWIKSGWHVFTDILEAILAIPLSIAQSIGDVFSNILDVGLLEWLRTAWDVFTDILEAILAIPLSIAQSIGDIFSSVFDNVLEWFKSAWNVFTDILEAILSIPKLIAEAIGNVLSALFVPSESDIEDLKDKFNKKLPFIVDLGDWSEEVSAIIRNPEDYASDLTFEVDMGKSETRFNYGNSKINLLELNWYFRYKEQVDALIIGLAWLIFLWNLYGQLPNILSLVGSGTILHIPNSTYQGSSSLPTLPTTTVESITKKGDNT